MADSSSRGYRDVAKFLERSAAPGDVVVITPEWNLDPLRHFAGTGLAVLAGANGGAALGAAPKRVWVVTPPWEDTVPAIGAGLHRSNTRTIGGIRVDLLTVE